jgi:hypothetical protein
VNQDGLFGELPPCPRTREGTHLEPTGSDAKGPPIEVCDACRSDATWNPGRNCPTPEVHTWKDPGADPGDEAVVEDEPVQEELT